MGSRETQQVPPTSAARSLFRNRLLGHIRHDLNVAAFDHSEIRKLFISKGRTWSPSTTLYKRLPEDRVVWINRVTGLDDARQLVAALQSLSVDHYLVYDFRERTIVEVFGSPAHAVSQLAA
jgi:hypothetical protein